MIVYKAFLAKVGGSLTSFSASVRDSLSLHSIKLGYEADVTTKRPKGCGSLAAFAYKSDATDFAKEFGRGARSAWQVWRCEATLTRGRKPKHPLYIGSEHPHPSDIPAGTVFCSSVTPIERVDHET